MNIFNTRYYFKTANWIVRRENAFREFHTFFGFDYHVSCLPWFETQNKILRCIDAPRYAFTHRNVPESEKYIWIIQNVHEKYKHYESSLGCLRLYGDSPVSRAQPRINAYEILLQYDWLLIFSRQNRFAETHSHLKLSYQITDRLLAAGNEMYLNVRNIYTQSPHKVLWLWQDNFAIICIVRV